MSKTIIIRSIPEFIEFCTNQHDIVCNQKYNGNLPYSFHLYAVAQQAKKFNYLLKHDRQKILVELGAWGHDLLEDARLTYNDIRYLDISISGHHDLQIELSEIIYSCTELRGRNRNERHGPEFFDDLKLNYLGLYDKLSDIIANITFGLLTNSDMVKKYRNEFPHLKKELFNETFKPMFDQIEKLLTL